MIEKTENKVLAIVNFLDAGNKADAAKKVRALTKIELFFLVSSHNKMVCPQLANPEKRVELEDFVSGVLEHRFGW